MEFIFEMFSRMLSMTDEENEYDLAGKLNDESNVAQFESDDAEDLPVAPMNLFEMINFH